MSIKKKAIDGFRWSLIDNLSRQAITFIIGIILARILSPREFGLIGMTTIFIAVSNTFLDGGFGAALIRKKECNQDDYSTVFFYNLIVSVISYLLIVIFAGNISDFFKEPQLKTIIQVLGAVLIIDAFAMIQQTILIKRIDFKLQTRISVISNVVSGVIGVILAYSGFGVWSLVFKRLAGSLLSAIFLWIWNKWIPSLVFSIKSFKEMFSFGSKLLLSKLIQTVYRNIYLLIIGKYFSAKDLGYYTRADQFSTLPIGSFTIVIERVTYPVLSTIHDDVQQMKSAYKRLIKSTALISFMMMLGLAVVSKPLILTLIGEKWLSSVAYLQLLCLVGMFYPLHALNLNILNVLGRSDLYLRLGIIKKILAVPIIIMGIYFGIKIMILGMLVISFFAYYINSYWSGKFINYSILEQARDIFPSFLLASFTAATVYFIGILIDLKMGLLLGVQILSGIFIFISLSELMKFKDYRYLKKIILDKLYEKG